MERRQRRAVRFTFEIGVPPSAEPTSLWVARPIDDEWQSVLGERLPNLPHDSGTDPQTGNRTLRFTAPASAQARTVEVSFDIERKLRRRSPPEPVPFSTTPPPTFLNANASVPLEGAIADQAQKLGRVGEPAVTLARRAFDYLLESMTYDRGGCTPERMDEIGDLHMACDIKTGTCTEFHGLLVGYLRVLHVPARFTFGFNIPKDSKAGAIKGYHCWSDVFLPDDSWFAVDVSEAWKRREGAPPQTREEEVNFYFGSLDADRVAFTRDRDVWLSPKQRGGPIDKFIFPYAEQATSGDEVPLELKFRFEELT